VLKLGIDLAEESLLAELIMSRRLDFNQDFRNRQAKHGLNVKDDAEWMQNDAAARWLQKNENRALRKADHRLSDQQAAPSARKSARRKRLKRRHAAIDPCDPHDQLAGVDMRRAPWK
jgi:hypothetical protein